MATAATMVSDALKEINILAEGETPSAEMADDALRALNRLMELWSNDQSFAYFASTVSLALTGQASFTVGPASSTPDVTADRPISVDIATVDRLGITYPVSVFDYAKWDAISYKGIAGANTSVVYYEATMPKGIVHVWPLATGCTLNLRVLNVVNSFANLATTLSMPPGYEEALIKNLAVNISPQYGVVPSVLTMRAATSSMKRINRTNNVIPTMEIDGALQNRRGSSIATFLGGV